ncbi:MAG: 4Fe-4S binding protein [Deltaproteobacteria bacterium]|nr:4Fe-4S binding protein [Deltaproteobacteria bacterium]
MTTDIIHNILSQTMAETKAGNLAPVDPAGQEFVSKLGLPGRRPTLCPGCPHRAAFYSIRQAFPRAIFTSDIGCYTLGLNLKAVDTVLDMGAGITMASGFYHAHHLDGTEKMIVATMGDSTFYHSGTAGLINAVYNDSRFVLVILDNGTTAMTGMQPTPGTGAMADGSPGNHISLERLIAGCGVDFIKVHDPYDVPAMIDLVKEAGEYIKTASPGIAVIIARHPCLIAHRRETAQFKSKPTVTAGCKGCKICLELFECPALYLVPGQDGTDSARVEIDRKICVSCGVCRFVCPERAIEIN